MRYLWLSEAAATKIHRAWAVHPVCALQSEYSLWSREIENSILLTIRELGIGLVAYASLGRRISDGTVSQRRRHADRRDTRSCLPRFQAGNFERNLAQVEELKEIAPAAGCIPAQLAIAWLFTRGSDVIPLFGTKRRAYLDENLGALEVRLGTTELSELDRIFTPGRGAAAGDRYPGIRNIDRG